MGGFFWHIGLIKGGVKFLNFESKMAFFGPMGPDLARNVKNSVTYFDPKHDISDLKLAPWPSEVSLKRASKLQLRDVDLWSVGHFSQKLWPNFKIVIFTHRILHYEKTKLHHFPFVHRRFRKCSQHQDTIPDKKTAKAF